MSVWVVPGRRLAATCACLAGIEPLRDRAPKLDPPDLSSRTAPMPGE